jgi:tetratricopeptide (TPR) repeat protein
MTGLSGAILPTMLLAMLLPGAALAAQPSGPAAQPAPRTAQTPHSDEADEATYERCMALAKRDPAAARDLAQRWRDRGGEHPADHCFAVALIGLKQYRDGATRLEALEQAMVHAPASLRAEVLDQAGQAWLLAGDPSRAYGDETSALGLSPGDADLLIDRAEAAGEAGWFDKAIADLDQALKADPRRVDALIYRATAYRALNRLDLALADADAAVRLAPGSAQALLERGNILRLKGDLAGARRDWARASSLAPGSVTDLAAKANIAHLEAPPPETPPAELH